MRRADVLAARKEEFDKWADSGALASARKRLKEIIDDPDEAAGNVVKAIELTFKYGYGIPVEQRETPPQMVLQIVRPGEAGWQEGVSLPQPEQLVIETTHTVDGIETVARDVTDERPA